ncbi:Peptidyl-prolyl cis-trans isomerase 1 [Gryllus bimaculatus]|nr:Peptidyl-prolyl cis-trans isomerase 1 [Gryllus bimaculatus]
MIWGKVHFHVDPICLRSNRRVIKQIEIYEDCGEAGKGLENDKCELKDTGKAASDEEEGELGEEKEGELHPLVTVTQINPEEIPDVPPNRFLFRGDNSAKKSKEEKPPERRRRPRIRGVTKSGRLIKGRGVFRYRTPSRSRSRSVTPPHWKQAQQRTIKLSEYEKQERERKKREEEIKRREEERKKRHMERDMQQRHADRDKPNEQHERDKEKRNEGETVVQTSEPEDGEVQTNITNIDNDMPPMSGQGPVDYNALDYETMDGGVSDKEEEEKKTKNTPLSEWFCSSVTENRKPVTVGYTAGVSWTLRRGSHRVVLSENTCKHCFKHDADQETNSGNF